MPPSGFSPAAIAGLLKFLEACYADLLKKLDADPKLDARTAIREELEDLRRAMQEFTAKG